jgi:hypothetical protein
MWRGLADRANTTATASPAADLTLEGIERAIEELLSTPLAPQPVKIYQSENAPRGRPFPLRDGYVMHPDDIDEISTLFGADVEAPTSEVLCG